LPAIGSRASAAVVMVERGSCRPHPRRPGIGCRTAGGMTTSLPS